jgi:hypothetical protein
MRKWTDVLEERKRQEELYKDRKKKESERYTSRKKESTYRKKDEMINSSNLKRK